MKTPTKQEYTQYLNDIGEGLSEAEFVIGGKLRKMKYGDAIRKYDPISFEVGYSEFCNDNRKLKKSKKMATQRDEFLDLVEGRLSGCGSRKRTKLSGIRGGKDNFTKADITKYAADKCGVSQAKAKCVIDAAFEFVKEMASDKNSCVTIAGFGSFRTKSYKFNSKLGGRRYSGTRSKLTFSPSKK